MMGVCVWDDPNLYPCVAVATGVGLFVLRLLCVCASLHPSVSQREHAAVQPQSDGALHLQLHPARYTLMGCVCVFWIGLWLPWKVISCTICHLNKLFCVCVCVHAGALILFLAFFAFLHCWLNAFAEMLRFGDRMFYRVRKIITDHYAPLQTITKEWVCYHLIFANLL